MKKIIRLTETELVNIITKIINEQQLTSATSNVVTGVQNTKPVSVNKTVDTRVANDYKNNPFFPKMGEQLFIKNWKAGLLKYDTDLRYIVYSGPVLSKSEITALSDYLKIGKWEYKPYSDGRLAWYSSSSFIKPPKNNLDINALMDYVSQIEFTNNNSNPKMNMDTTYRINRDNYRQIFHSKGPKQDKGPGNYVQNTVALLSR